MSFFLSKFLLFLIKPLVWVFVLLLFSLFVKNARKKRQLLIAAIAMALFFSNKVIVTQVAKWYEPTFPALQHYKVGILLGGFSSFNQEASTLKSQYAGDRLTQTLKLYYTGYIDKILMSGGSGRLFDKTVVEADYTKDYLQAIKLPDNAVIVENKSRNTKENFVYAMALLGELGEAEGKILVITSAWHIPRTKLLAEKQGLMNFDYYPTNSMVDSLTIEDYWLPQPSAIWHWEILVKEWVGYITTRIGLT
jgi:uncharacterized SAM-binding protein YcdF (DUF218 family)